MAGDKALSRFNQQPDDHTYVLQAAARGGSEPIVRYMLSSGMKAGPRTEGGASVTPDTPETTGTPLPYAVWEEDSSMISDLLERGADANQRGTVFGRTKSTFPLLLAIEKGNLDIVSQLIHAGAKVDDQDVEGFSLLHIAAAGKDGRMNCIEAVSGDVYSYNHPVTNATR
ncbi:hypothetical protein QQZ08_003928 [Neonectria magnoliae]|uniref:Ankyrin n=1 Tax=Neonectria magnoliae TaxID=2732573 RepID=A0ABR1I7H9_9HYPO